MTSNSQLGTKTAIGSQTNAMINEVQRKIYGQREDKLTAVEINRLFQAPITPEFNLVIYKGLQRNAISADVALLQAIPRARTHDYIISIALCLRFGADANMYVNAPNLGTIHILGYVYNILGGDKFSNNIEMADENVINTIILMLIAKGSRPSMSMFDNKAGKIRNENEIISSSPTVSEWLSERGYNTILDRVSIGEANELQKFVDKDSLITLSILLDMPNLAGREYESRDMIFAIKSFSQLSFDRIPTPTTKIMMDYKSLDDSVTYLNSISFDKLINRGQLPSYVIINRILMGMKSYRNLGRIIALQELETMLMSSISVGIQLDQDQLSIVSTLGQDILDSVTREYEQPYWRKVCKAPNSVIVDSSDAFRSNNNIPDALKRLAISLNIDPTLSKAAICENINKLSKADKEALKEAARKRQQTRMATEMGTMSEFIGDKIPNLVCRNRSLLPHDPFDYNDIDIAYYRDDQGAVWCFTSDMFSSILESGVNPYNMTSLPDSFKDQLKYQLNALQRLGIDSGLGEIGVYSSRSPLTFEKSIDSLSNKDSVSESSSQHSLNTFIKLANSNNVSSDTIRTLSKDRMISALRSIDYNVDLDPLSTSHALVTTSHIIEYVNKIDPDLIKIFFSSINIPRI